MVGNLFCERIGGIEASDINLKSKEDLKCQLYLNLDTTQWQIQTLS